ncbi:MAG TPA: septum formation initiator family protein [Candidatus Humimicrobiaceae bacterium]|nr:septum formation initiator family protein [Candidatus Humimicrobiaceae bacterium]
MDNNIKIVSRLSRKAKINISIVIFLIFIVITILVSINQIRIIVENREKVIELEEKLNWYRNQNIDLLALEKSLYGEEALELEARKQFNMTTGDEINVSVVVKDEETGSEAENNSESAFAEKVYSSSDLWGNIKTFYDNEIKSD